MFRRWLFVFILALIFFYTTIAFISSQVTFPLITRSNVLNPKFYDYAGITHAHSIFSTGSGTIEEIAKYANIAHCQFVIVTDLNPNQKLKLIEGYRDDVLVIWGGEYSYLGGHLLAYNLPEAQTFKGPGQAQLFFNDLLSQDPRPASKGFAIAAHPFLPDHGWGNLKIKGLSGLEVLNLDSIWRSQIAK